MFEKLTDAIFPPVCPVCRKIPKGNGRVCPECMKELFVVKEPKCKKCGKPLTDEKLYCNDCRKKKHLFEQGVAVFEYRGKMRQSLYRFKYKNAREYGKFYAKAARELYADTLESWDISVIVPVPMYEKKEKQRGYNQAKVFGEDLSRCTGIPVDEECIIRRKNTVPQKDLSDEMRKENLTGAFAVNMVRVAQYENILLVDDIYTTGSTIDACAGILLAAGAKKIYFLCVSTGKDSG